LSRLLTPNVKRVLEVGCAEGALGEAIKTRFAVTYEGIELSQDAERAQAKLDRVYRTPAALTAAPPYDLIVSFHVLE
ncbi:MAG: class I SAM-dependent methyltransferase, partial [Azovibrio sp.]|nr:class I SAM-dependent methyltransferase [Azovibrio sp.]